MTLTATFLAGSLLSLLLPVLLLIALVVWYVGFVRRVPDAGDATEASTIAGASNPVPAAAPASGPSPGASAPGSVPPADTGRTP